MTPQVQESNLSAYVCPEHGPYGPARFCCACTREADRAAQERGYQSERDELLHAMHDASTFAEGATKAILEGVLHRYEYGARRGTFRGNRCTCPHCQGGAQ